MTDDPDLTSAYALNSAEDAKRLYAEWAESYDRSFGDAQGYLLPRHVTEVFVNSGGLGPVLDVGAGTGLVAQGLSAAHVGPIDGTDLSDEMLAVAQKQCLFVISANAAHFQKAGFADFFQDPDAGLIDLQYEDRRIYSDKADLSHRYDMARVVSFRNA